MQICRFFVKFDICQILRLERQICFFPSSANKTLANVKFEICRFFVKFEKMDKYQIWHLSLFCQIWQKNDKFDDKFACVDTLLKRNYTLYQFEFINHINYTYHQQPADDEAIIWAHLDIKYK